LKDFRRYIAGLPAAGGLPEVSRKKSLVLVGLDANLDLANPGLLKDKQFVVNLSAFKSEIGDVLLNQGRVVSFVVAVVLAGAVYLFLGHTRLGKGLRAAADNPQAAIYMGIDVDRAHRLAWSIGVGITAVAGGLIATSQTFQPYVGFDFVIVMYAGVIMESGPAKAVLREPRNPYTVALLEARPRPGAPRGARRLPAAAAPQVDVADDPSAVVVPAPARQQRRARPGGVFLDAGRLRRTADR
jgi:hypothetical protein